MMPMPMLTLMLMTWMTTPHDRQSMIAYAHSQMSQKYIHVETDFLFHYFWGILYPLKILNDFRKMITWLMLSYVTHVSVYHVSAE